MSTLRFYRHPLSGHCHRVELFLSILGLEHEVVDVDLKAGAHKRPEFLQKNPFGKIPLLEDGSRVIWDSNAILVYLAKRYDSEHRWLPEDAPGAEEVQRYLSIAAGDVAFGPCAARLVNVFGAQLDHQGAINRAHALLKVLNSLLADREWLATGKPSIADLANYAYIAHAPEGGVSLEDYPHVRAWLQRIENLPGFVPMQATRVSLAA